MPVLQAPSPNTTPHVDDAVYPLQAYPDKGDFAVAMMATLGYRWQGGCAVGSSGADLTATITAGAAAFGPGEASYPTPAGTVTLIPDSTGTRSAFVGVDFLPAVSYTRASSTVTLLLSYDPVAQGWQAGEAIYVQTDTADINSVIGTPNVLTNVHSNGDGTGTISWTDAGTTHATPIAVNGVVTHAGVWHGVGQATLNRPKDPAIPPAGAVICAVVYMDNATLMAGLLAADRITDKRTKGQSLIQNSVNAADFGMGVGMASKGPYAGTFVGDGLAFAAAYTEAVTKANWGGTIGCILEVPAGELNLTDTYGGGGTVVPLVLHSPGPKGGHLTIRGQGSGVSILTAPDRGGGFGCLGWGSALQSVARGGSGGGPADLNGSGFDDNTITLGFSAAHNGVLGQFIYLMTMSKGRPVPTHYSIQTPWGPGSHHTTTAGGAQNLNTATSLQVASTTGYGTSGQVSVLSDVGLQLVSYSNKDATHFLGITGGKGTVTNGADVYDPDFTKLQIQAGDHTSFKGNTFTLTGVTSTAGVYAATGHGGYVGMPIVPTSVVGGSALTVGTTYYMIAGSFDADHFKLSLTPGGAAVTGGTNETNAAFSALGTTGAPDKGRTVGGGYLDLLKPPVSYIDWDSDPLVPATVTNQPVYFLQYLLEFLDYKQPHGLHIEQLSIEGGSNTDTPLDGIGLRHCMRNHIEDTVKVSGWWIGAGISDNAHSSAPTAAGVQSGQNSDHSWCHGIFDGNAYHLGFIDNSQTGYGKQGGGRDYHFSRSIFNRPGRGHIIVNDAGSLQTIDLEQCNFAGGRHTIYCEGVDGVDPVEPRGVDCVVGWFKTEAQGTWVFGYDETNRRTFWKAMDFHHRCESSVTTNGQGGTPGGAGETAVGSFPDDTWKPWPCLNQSLRTDTAAGTNATGAWVSGHSYSVNDIASDSGVNYLCFVATSGTTAPHSDTTHWKLAMPTFKADVPWAMFGADGGLEIGSHVCPGYQRRQGTDGHSTGVGNIFQSTAANFTLDDAPVKPGLPGSTIVIDPGSPAIFTDGNGNPTRQDTVASVTNGGAVVMTNPTAAHTTADIVWTIVDTIGSSNASGLSTMSITMMVKSVSAPFSSGGGLFCTITCERPDLDPTLFGTAAPNGYGSGLGTASSSTYSSLIGLVGYLRCGLLDAWNAEVLHDTQASDRLTMAQKFYDCHSLRPGYLELVVDNTPTNTKVLPHFRVWDGISRSSADGVATTGLSYFTAASARPAGLEVGKRVTVGSQTGTITYINYADPNDLTSARIGLSFAVSAGGSTLAWNIATVKNIDAPRFEIRRGLQRFFVTWREATDLNPIPAGGLLEWVNTINGNGRVRASQCDKFHAFAGVCMTACPAGSATAPNPATGTNGASFPTTPGIGPPEVWPAGPTVIVALPGTILTTGDDPCSFSVFGAFGSTVTTAVIVDDGATHPGYSKGTVGSGTGERIVGSLAHGSTNTPYIAGQVLPERWT
jgi:hypothetical protein